MDFLEHLLVCFFSEQPVSDIGLEFVCLSGLSLLNSLHAGVLIDSALEHELRLKGVVVLAVDAVVHVLFFEPAWDFEEHRSDILILVGIPLKVWSLVLKAAKDNCMEFLFPLNFLELLKSYLTQSTAY